MASHLQDRVRFPVVLRSTKSGYGGTSHPPHDGSCGVVDCRLDRHGWISHEKTARIPASELTASRWSCREPDLDIHELVMGILADVHRTRGRRRRSRRGESR